MSIGACHKCRFRERPYVSPRCACTLTGRDIIDMNEKGDCPHDFDPSKTERSRDTSCMMRGLKLRTVECPRPSCSGKNVKLKVFACATHGECSLSDDAGVKSCRTCKDRVPVILS